MSEIPNVIGGDTATAAWANDIKNRTAMRYATAAARDVSLPAAVDGELAYLQDSDTLTMRAASSWVTVGSEGAELATPIFMPGMLVDSLQFFQDNMGDANLLGFVVIPGSSLVGSATVTVTGTVGRPTVAGLAGGNFSGTGVTNEVGDSVSLETTSTVAAFARSCSVPLTLGNNTITLNTTQTAGLPDYRGVIQAFIDPT